LCLGGPAHTLDSMTTEVEHRDATQHLILPTSFGPVAVVWGLFRGRPSILRVVLSRPGMASGRWVGEAFPGSKPGTCAEIAAIGGRMQTFLEGAAVAFDLEDARLDLCSQFQRRVLIAEHGIPRGRVSTYGLIAARLGAPSASRAVGRALATNPFPIIVPCHRAIRFDGTLGGYQGGPAMKRRLLELEGVAVDRSGRVQVDGLHYAGAATRRAATRRAWRRG